MKLFTFGFMEFIDAITKKTGKSFIVNLNAVIKDNGYKLSDFDLFYIELSLITGTEVYTIVYKPQMEFRFLFFWRQKTDTMEIINYLINDDINNLPTKANYAHDNSNGIIVQISNWIKSFKEIIRINNEFEKILNPNQLDENSQIKSEDREFGQTELDVLKAKMDEIETTIFKTQGLTLDAVEELKQMLVEVLNKASTNATKSEIEETIIGKVLVKVKNHLGDEIFKSVAMKTLKEILSVFSGYSKTALPPFIQNLLS